MPNTNECNSALLYFGTINDNGLGPPVIHPVYLQFEQSGVYIAAQNTACPFTKN